jgi:hypothetical protein
LFLTKIYFRIHIFGAIDEEYKSLPAENAGLSSSVNFVIQSLKDEKNPSSSLPLAGFRTKSPNLFFCER